MSEKANTDGKKLYVSFNSLIAGAAAGIVCSVICAPLDIAKVCKCDDVYNIVAWMT